MYAVLKPVEKQYRVAAGDKLQVERLETRRDKPFTFDRVLLVNNDGKLAVGSPTSAARPSRGCGLPHPRREEADFQEEAPQGLPENHRPSSGITVVQIRQSTRKILWHIKKVKAA